MRARFVLAVFSLAAVAALTISGRAHAYSGCSFIAQSGTAASCQAIIDSTNFPYWYFDGTNCYGCMSE